MIKLSLSHVQKHIGKKQILHDVSLDIEEGEFIVVLGPSGCGKTTLLRMIAGLETISEGEIILDGRLVNQLAPRHRDIAMVFQNYSLYMHMTVWENMAFGLRTRKTPKREIEKQVEMALETLKIQNLRDRKPGQLSGGEKQRVAIGRALVRRPKLYLFDEPLSNLDASLRMELRSEIKRLHQRFGNTSIYVTHDQVEAMSMADRLVVMNEGRIMQIGRTETVYSDPKSTFVASFLGNPGMNLLPARLIQTGGSLSLDVNQCGIPLSTMGINVNQEDIKPDSDEILFGFRPESARFTEFAGGSVMVRARVLLVERLGSETQVVLDCPSGEFRIRERDRLSLNVGEQIDVHIPYSDVRLFSKASQKVIFQYKN